MNDTREPEAGAMSVPEFARFAGIGQSTAWNAIRNREVLARKAGRRTLILRDDAFNYLKGLPIAGRAA